MSALSVPLFGRKNEESDHETSVRRRGHAHTQKHAPRSWYLLHTDIVCCSARCSSECGGGSGGGARSLQLLNVRLSAPLIKIKSCFALRRNNNVFPQ